VVPRVAAAEMALFSSEAEASGRLCEGGDGVECEDVIDIFDVFAVFKS
jgi:hypothetical protein